MTVGIALIAFPRTGLGLSFLVFVGVLGLGYEWCHYLIHSDYKPKTGLYRAIWKNHRQHHYKNEHYWFTVTSAGTADRVLGTRPDYALGRHVTHGEEPARRHAWTMIGSPMLTWLKYHAALSGLRLMQPWLTFALPCDATDHGAECT